MLRRPPRSTRTDTLVPYTTLFRSALKRLKVTEIAAEDLRQPPVLPIGLPLDEARRRMDADALDFAVVLDDERRLHRSEEHTSELQSLMRISYAVFCLKKNKRQT